MTNRAAWLRAALANVHADPTWWRTVLVHGALMLSLVGWPLSTGLVTENLDNARKAQTLFALGRQLSQDDYYVEVDRAEGCGRARPACLLR